MPTNDVPPEDQLAWYRRRVAALEVMLASYRTGRLWISEAVHKELEATGVRIDHQGQWRQEP